MVQRSQPPPSASLWSNRGPRNPDPARLSDLWKSGSGPRTEQTWPPKRFCGAPPIIRLSLRPHGWQHEPSLRKRNSYLFKVAIFWGLWSVEQNLKVAWRHPCLQPKSIISEITKRGLAGKDNGPLFVFLIRHHQLSPNRWIIGSNCFLFIFLREALPFDFQCSNALHLCFDHLCCKIV